MTAQEKKTEWMSFSGMPEELLLDLAGMDENKTKECFSGDLAFGTGGLRGILGAGTNRMNLYTVIKATKGLGHYLLEHHGPFTKCAVSYDSRIHSRDFAETASAVLASMGIHVYMYPQLQPTPMLSFAVRVLECKAGVMITASHNPSRYNGYKVYGSDGCQITLEQAEQITGYINKQPMLTENIPVFREQTERGQITLIGTDTIEAYYDSVLKLRCMHPTCPLHVVYTPLNGTGNVPVREILRRMENVRTDIVEEQEAPDGAFPTCPYPNPEIKEAMSLAIQRTIDQNADLCFATDPDCDRMGAGVRVGNEVTLISGNDMGILMLDYLFKNRINSSNSSWVVFKTIVTTDMAESFCRRNNIELKNVLTGFKFIGEQIGLLESNGQEDRFLLGFEESYGYLTGTFVRDKDGVIASMLLCDMAADLKEAGKTLLDRLEELRKEYGCFAQRLITFAYEGREGAEKMSGIMKRLRGPMSSFESDDFRGSFRIDYLYDRTGLPGSDVLSFRMTDGAKVIIRPSGTEAKLKAYLSAQAESMPMAEKILDNLQNEIEVLCG